MGIRFECPNGHRLNVKAFLAGKRGICPDCDARFLVPMESGGRAQVIEETAESAVAEAEAPPPFSAPPIVVPPISAADPAEKEAWYIRPTAGAEQYGPADAETMRGWAAEGRVSQDSWVWRTGWPDWKRGLEALALLNSSVEAVAPVATVPLAESAAAIDVATRKKARTHRSARRERAKKITVMLSAVVVLLLVVLAIVLSR